MNADETIEKNCKFKNYWSISQAIQNKKKIDINRKNT
jgi:hypothetical protein